MTPANHTQSREFFNASERELIIKAFGTLSKQHDLQEVRINFVPIPGHNKEHAYPFYVRLPEVTIRDSKGHDIEVCARETKKLYRALFDDLKAQKIIADYHLEQREENKHEHTEIQIKLTPHAMNKDGKHDSLPYLEEAIKNTADEKLRPVMHHAHRFSGMLNGFLISKNIKPGKLKSAVLHVFERPHTRNLVRERYEELGHMLHYLEGKKLISVENVLPANVHADASVKEKSDASLGYIVMIKDRRKAVEGEVLKPYSEALVDAQNAYNQHKLHEEKRARGEALLSRANENTPPHR